MIFKTDVSNKRLIVEKAEKPGAASDEEKRE